MKILAIILSLLTINILNAEYYITVSKSLANAVIQSENENSQDTEPTPII